MNNADLEHRLAALLSADVVSYSRLMAEDELGTIRTLTAYSAEMRARVDAYRGRVVNFVGDNMLAEFSSTLDAVNCAVEIQQVLANFNTKLTGNRRMDFRIGLHLGDVAVDGDLIFGDGVNIAARLEALAQPGAICISDMVYNQVINKLDIQCVDLGEQTLKNIPKPVRVYRIVEADSTTPAATGVVATIADTSNKTEWMPPPHQPSLAVLPFVNLGADPGQDYFSEGLTLDIMTALVKIPGLFLIADSSMFSYKSKPVTVQELGRDLGVSHVLDGGVRTAGNRVRITARLIETASMRQVWAESYDRQLDDLFAVQDEITREIVTAMDIKLVSGESARTIRQTLKNPAAIEIYYRGWKALFSTAKEDLYEAREMFEKTILLEPESSLGYAMAAWAHWWIVFRGLSNDASQSLQRATELAEQAVRLEDITGLPHLMMAQIYLLKHDHSRALAEAELAVLARPSCDGSFVAKANILIYLGRPAEAIELAKFAMRLTPVYPVYYPAVLAAAYYGCGRHEEAIAAALNVLQSDRDNLDALLILAGASAALGRLEEAQKACREVIASYPDFTLEKYAASQPYQEPQTLEQVIGVLQKAGFT
jgi:TolB-like protein/class 3 adenylate cyclase